MFQRLKLKLALLVLAPLIMGAAPCETQLAELLSDSDSSQVSDQDLVEAYTEDLRVPAVAVVSHH